MKDYVFSTKPQAHPDAIIQGPHYRFTILTDRLIRYEWSHDGKFEDRASTFAINREFPVPKFKVIDHGHELEIVTDYCHIEYDKKRFSTSGLFANFNAKVTLWGAQWRYGETLPEWRANLGGTARTLDGVDGRCDMGSGALSRQGYASIDDSKSMLFDGHGFVAGRNPGDRIDGYLFFYGLDYKETMKAYYAVSGSQPLLPRWALGNWWSRYYAYEQQEYLDLMDQFREKNMPLSVAVIDMDWHLVNDDRVTHAGWGGYTWDDKLFPDPVKFGKELHRRNLKITLNDHPHPGIHAFEDSYKEMAKFMGHDTSEKHPIVWDPTNPKFLEAFFKIVHRNVEKAACDFWWIDWQQGEHSKIAGVDPLWVLNHFQFLDTARTYKTPLVFSRFAGPGSHRYPVGFSGDSMITWDSLAFQPEFTATASNIGYGWWSHDIGGHYGGYRDDELVTRWVQYGVFSPIFRLHSSNSQWSSKEPWLYGKEFELVMENHLRLRHRLLPYLYNANILSASNDEPIVQPIYWRYPEIEEAYSVPNEYFFGPDLIAAPITRARCKQTGLAWVNAWLPPAGRYVDIFTGIVYDGNRQLNLYRTLDSIPVFAGEGSIIPLDANPFPANGCPNPTAFEILVVIGKDGQCSILEDPADDSPASKKAAPDTAERGSLVQYDQKSGKLTAHVTGRTWTFRFLSLTSPPKGLKVLTNGKPNKSAKVSTTTYPDVPSVVVEIPAVTDDKYTITIELGADPQLSIIDHGPRIRDMLREYQGKFAYKDSVWNIVIDKKSPISSRVGRLLALNLDDDLKSPMAELLLADSRSTHL